MGTRFELVLAGGARELRAAGEAALEEIDECHRRLSRFEPDSLLSHINRTAFETPVRLDRDTFGLFADAARVWRDSDGAFDITVAPLMTEQGFAPSAVAGEASGAGAIALDEAAWTIRFTRPAVSLDLGAIAKGHALERAAALLRAQGVTSALLHGGTSSVVAIGRPPGADAWRVRAHPSDPHGVIALRDSALAVSGAGGQRRADQGAHIIDPRTALPVPRARRVAVVGPSARLADAWATALAVLGRLPETFPAGYRALLDFETTPCP